MIYSKQLWEIPNVFRNQCVIFKMIRNRLMESQELFYIRKEREEKNVGK